MENRTKKLVKVGAAVTSLALVGAVSFGLTTAYLTANTQEKTNTFTSSAKVITELDEPIWGTSNEKTYEPGETYAKDPEVKIVTKSEDAYLAATIEFKVMSNDGTTEIPLKYAEFKTLADIYGATTSDVLGSYDDADATGVWKPNGTIDDSALKITLYYYKNDSSTDLKVMKQDETTDSIFENVAFKSETEFTNALKAIYTNYVSDFNEDTDSVKYNDTFPQIKIEIKSYALQAEGVTSAEAITGLYGMINAT